MGAIYLNEQLGQNTPDDLEISFFTRDVCDPLIAQAIKGLVDEIRATHQKKRTLDSSLTSTEINAIERLETIERAKEQIRDEIKTEKLNIRSTLQKYSSERMQELERKKIEMREGLKKSQVQSNTPYRAIVLKNMQEIIEIQIQQMEQSFLENLQIQIQKERKELLKGFREYEAQRIKEIKTLEAEAKPLRTIILKGQKKRTKKISKQSQAETPPATPQTTPVVKPRSIPQAKPVVKQRSIPQTTPVVKAPSTPQTNPVVKPRSSSATTNTPTESTESTNYIQTVTRREIAQKRKAIQSILEEQESRLDPNKPGADKVVLFPETFAMKKERPTGQYEWVNDEDRFQIVDIKNSGDDIKSRVTNLWEIDLNTYNKYKNQGDVIVAINGNIRRITRVPRRLLQTTFNDIN